MERLYADAIAYMMQRLPMFARIGTSAVKHGLKNIIALCDALDNPQKGKKFIHIAGTNGKGSTSHILAATLQKAGYKTGLYTSPHLVDLRERVRINGQPVSKEFVIDFIENAKPLVERIQPSYFELNVAMAFKAFAEEDVDIAVIETGLGGRLDSTNIITPILSVITNISYDHVNILGDTLPEIALEKAGIIKDEIPVVIGETHPETESIFFREALKHKSSVYFADSIWDMVKSGQGGHLQHFKAVDKSQQKIYPVTTDLLGSYQAHNIKTALAATEILERLGWNVNIATCIEALSSVKKSTGLRGRWDWTGERPDIFLDVAHNPAGIALAMDNLIAMNSIRNYNKVHIVCGFVKDKDVSAVLKLMPKNAVYYFTRADVPRAMPAEELYAMAINNELKGDVYPNVSDAVKAASSNALKNDVVLITGSFFVVGEAIVALDNEMQEKTCTQL